MGEPIDRAYLEIDSKIVPCESIDADFDDGTDWVLAMTKDNEPLGVSSGNRRVEIKAEVSMREDEDEDVDFIELWKEKKNIPVSLEFESGRTFSFARSRLSKPSVGSKHGEKVVWKLELKCWGLTVS